MRVSDFEGSLAQTQKLIREDEIDEQSKLIQAAGKGRRIICNQLNAYPTVMNLRAEEELSSPEKHHLLGI